MDNRSGDGVAWIDIELLMRLHEFNLRSLALDLLCVTTPPPSEQWPARRTFPPRFAGHHAFYLSGAEIELVRMIRQMESREHRMPAIAKRRVAGLVRVVERGIDIDPWAISGKLNRLALAGWHGGCR